MIFYPERISFQSTIRGSLFKLMINLLNASFFSSFIKNAAFIVLVIALTLKLKGSV